MWWVKYTSNVAFLALMFAFSATLLVGWSWAGQVPFLGSDAASQNAALTAGLTVLIIAAPIWLIHWVWACKSWVWESPTAQYYLAFFTVVGLGAAVFIGVQLVNRLLNLAAGAPGLTWEGSASFVFGATWSVVWSLLLWAYHGFTWLKYRERRRSAVGVPARV